MFALINTLDASGQVLGTVISLHRSESAALAAQDRHTRMVKRVHGKGFYIPKMVVELRHKPKSSLICKEDTV